MEEIYAVAHKFTAFMCCSDYYAVTLMKYLRERGIRFPEDLSITGFDDNLYAQVRLSSPYYDSPEYLSAWNYGCRVSAQND